MDETVRSFIFWSNLEMGTGWKIRARAEKGKSLTGRAGLAKFRAVGQPVELNRGHILIFTSLKCV